MTHRQKLSVCLLGVALLTNGCGILMPKQVELFQRKVRAVPVMPDSAEERQRQAADRIASELYAASLAAQLEHSTTNVTKPIHDAHSVADGLSTSLGPPESPYTGPAASLGKRLKNDRAELNSDVRDYADHVAQDVNKKIEGTGLVRVGYFTMIGGLLLLGALVWFGLKVYGVFNPVIGGVTSVIGRVSSSVLQKGFTQIVSGGERFKDAIDESHLDEQTAAYVKKLFASCHQQAQDTDVKKVVEGITRYNEPVIVPLPTPPPAA